MEEKEKHDKKSNGTTEMTDYSINADENAAGTTHLSEPVEEQNAAEQLQAELEEQKNKYIRLYAEFDNFRRRTAKEKLDLIQTAGKDVISSLLDILDDCDRAEKQMQQTDDAEQLKEGALLIFNKLRNTLQARGLKAMVSLEKDFDV